MLKNTNHEAKKESYLFTLAANVISVAFHSVSGQILAIEILGQAFVLEPE